MQSNPTKIAPTTDDRNKKVTVYDTAGNPFEHTNTNARELVRHMNFTLDEKEAESRRGKPLTPVVIANDGTPTATQQAQEKAEAPAAEPVWEDLTTINLDVLRKAATFLKLPDIDGRSGAKRIVATFDAALDQVLSASGDFTGARRVADDASNEDKVKALAENVARRRRAFAVAAHSAGVAFGEQTSLAQLLTSIAALVDEPQE